jgi:predicted RNA-binding Zn-ribbon protein involved in translation (DUF1610 family)
MAETGVRPRCPKCGNQMNASFQSGAESQPATGKKAGYAATWECPVCGEEAKRATTKVASP